MMSPRQQGITMSVVFAALAFVAVYMFGGQSSDSAAYGLGAAFFVIVAGVIMHNKGWKLAYAHHIAHCEAASKQMTEQLTANKEYAASITRAEFNLMNSLNQCMKDFAEMGQEHPGEMQRFSEHIHDAVTMVMARVGVRSAVVMAAAEEQGDPTDINII